MDTDDQELIKQLESIGVLFRKSKTGRILVVDFRESKVAIDDTIACRLCRLPRLKEIHLPDTAITDQAIESFAELKKLQTLNVDGTQVTDQGLHALLDCPKLAILSLLRTEVTREKVADLRKKMIGTRIVFRT